jgi:hypothetical protein
MTDFKEQCVCIKFCFGSGKTDMETFEVLKLAFGGHSEQTGVFH